jgi:hypothetical protein
MDVLIKSSPQSSTVKLIKINMILAKNMMKLPQFLQVVLTIHIRENVLLCL